VQLVVDDDHDSNNHHHYNCQRLDEQTMR
jgi:hypothetical protein